MGTVSIYRVYYKRTYLENNVKKLEEQREMAQINNTNSSNINQTTEENRYLLYEINDGYRSSYPPFPSNNRKYAAYVPGLVYIPEKYYSKRDLFPSGFFSGFEDALLSYTGADDFKEFVMWTVAIGFGPDYDGSNGYRRNFFNKKYAFSYDDSSGFNSFVNISITLNLGYNQSISRKHTFRITVGLIYIDNKINKDNVFWNTNNNAWWVNAEEPDGPRALKTTEIYTGTNLFIVCNSESNVYYSLDEISEELTKADNILKNIKFYPCPQGINSGTLDNISYAFSSWNRVSTPNKLSNLNFLVDVSNCPYFPTTGFYTSTNNTVIFDYNIVNDSLNSNNPDITKDPNIDDPGYGPGQNPDDKGGDGNHDNTSDDIKPPSIPTLSASGAGLITIFNPTQGELAQLAKSLWTPTALEAIKQYFTNPLDCILGLSIVPVKPSTASSREILLGLYKSGVTSALVDSDYVIVNCGSIPIERYYGSYLDYSPYTKIRCYLPYIGEVDVNPDEVMQTSLMVLYYVNVVTGDIVAMLCANDNILYTVASNCIRQLPLSSTDYSSIINTAVSAVSGIAMAAATAGVGSASVAAAEGAKAATDASKHLAAQRATASNVGSATSLVGDVMNAKANYQHAGTIGTGSGQLSYQKPYLIIERPNLDLADNYKSFVGYPCNKNRSISHCSGFTQIEASNLAVANATDEEVAEIKELLLRGVII